MDRFIGKRLDGRYEIHELIGVGGMAYVYKAYDRMEDRWVAIKILKEEFSNNSDFLRRFRNESKAIAVLNHPNIVKVSTVISSPRTLCCCRTAPLRWPILVSRVSCKAKRKP